MQRFRRTVSRVTLEDAAIITMALKDSGGFSKPCVSSCVPRSPGLLQRAGER